MTGLYQGHPTPRAILINRRHTFYDLLNVTEECLRSCNDKLKTPELAGSDLSELFGKHAPSRGQSLIEHGADKNTGFSGTRGHSRLRQSVTRVPSGTTQSSLRLYPTLPSLSLRPLNLNL